MYVLPHYKLPCRYLPFSVITYILLFQEATSSFLTVLPNIPHSTIKIGRNDQWPKTIWVRPRRYKSSENALMESTVLPKPHEMTMTVPNN